MKSNNLNSKLVDMLNERFPQKNLLANDLCDILYMEKESVYRRLRKEVPFTLDETEILAQKLGISLDGLIGTSTSLYNPHARPVTSPNKSREDMNFEVLVNYVEKVKQISQQPNSEHAQALNYIPLGLCVGYPHLVKFLVYRFLHLYDSNGQLKPFSDYKISSRIEEEFQRLDYYLKKISYTYYIWDVNVIPNLVDNLQYFTSMQMINQQEIVQFKKELLRYLDDLESYTIESRFPQTQNRFDLFISGMHIGFTHAYLCCDSIYMSIFMTFVLQTVTSLDKNTCQEVHSRITCLKKLSTQISMVGERDRIQFFQKQRQIVDTL